MEFFSRVQTQPFEGIISCPLSFLVWPSPSYWSLSLTLVPPLPSLCSSSLPLLLPFTLLPLPHSALSPLLCSYPLFCIFSLTSFPLPHCLHNLPLFLPLPLFVFSLSLCSLPVTLLPLPSSYPSPSLLSTSSCVKCRLFGLSSYHSNCLYICLPDCLAGSGYVCYPLSLFWNV